MSGPGRSRPFGDDMTTRMAFLVPCFLFFVITRVVGPFNFSVPGVLVIVTSYIIHPGRVRMNASPCFLLLISPVLFVPFRTRLLYNS